MQMDQALSPSLFCQKGGILSQNWENLWLITGWNYRTFEMQSIDFQNPLATTYFYAPEFDFKRQSQWVEAENLQRTTTEEAFRLWPFPLLSDSNLQWTSELSSYKNDYETVMQRIQKGPLEKAVPFMLYKTLKPKNFQSKILPQIIRRLLQIDDGQMLYGLWEENSGFVGSTPEILLQGQAENLKLMALASTLKSSDPTNMWEDPKLKQEHLLVVKDIEQKLKNCGQVSWEKTHEAIYGPIKHLCTWGQLEKTQASLGQLLRVLSPTSALGVHPHEELAKNLDVLHAAERGSYGAPFGVVDQNFAHFVVCLRGLFWDETHLTIPVGGGVIGQSDYKTELKELELKFLSTKNKLGL